MGGLPERSAVSSVSHGPGTWKIVEELIFLKKDLYKKK